MNVLYKSYDMHSHVSNVYDLVMYCIEHCHLKATLSHISLCDFDINLDCNTLDLDSIPYIESKCLLTWHHNSQRSRHAMNMQIVSDSSKSAKAYLRVS